MRHYDDPYEQLIAGIVRQIAAERGEELYPQDMERIINRMRDNQSRGMYTTPPGVMVRVRQLEDHADDACIACEQDEQCPPPIVTGPGGDYRQPYTPRPWQRDTVTWWLCWIITGVAAGVLLAALITLG